MSRGMSHAISRGISYGIVFLGTSAVSWDIVEIQRRVSRTQLRIVHENVSSIPGRLLQCASPGIVAMVRMPYGIVESTPRGNSHGISHGICHGNPHKIPQNMVFHVIPYLSHVQQFPWNYCSHANFHDISHGACRTRWDTRHGDNQCHGRSHGVSHRNSYPRRTRSVQI